MPNFVIQFHLKDVIAALDAYLVHFEKYCRMYNNEDGCLDDSDGNLEKIAVSVNTLNNMFDDKHDKIFNAISGDIIRYLRLYNVNASGGVDQFKLIYFTGMALARFVAREGDVYAQRVLQFATAVQLDQCMHREVDGVGGRKSLLLRMRGLIENGELEERLGLDGLYMIYKVGANLLRDHAGIAPSVDAEQPLTPR